MFGRILPFFSFGLFWDFAMDYIMILQDHVNYIVAIVLLY